MKTKLEIIDETIRYYSQDTTRRAVEYTEDGMVLGCKYRTSDGKMCAVGRCMVNPDGYMIGLVSNIRVGDNRTYVNNLLNEEYKGHSEGFWLDLQALHDNSKNWDKKGLSLKGRQYAKSLKNKYHE